MDLLLSLNASAIKREPSFKKFSDLPYGSYTVKKFVLKDTNFGLRLLVLVDDFYLTLPQRFSDKISKAGQVEELNQRKFRLVYGGKDQQNFNMLKIDFNVVEPAPEPAAAEAVPETETPIIPNYEVPPTDEETETETQGDEEIIIPARTKRHMEMLVKNVYPNKRSRS